MPMPPEPGPGEVLVRLRAVGICGSDMHWYKEGGIGASRAAYPMVLGHEPAGEIVAVGKGVEDLVSGQRVAVEPAITCGHCEFCMSGHHNNCVGSIFMGASQWPGLFREYAVMPARNVMPIPAGMSFVARHDSRAAGRDSACAGNGRHPAGRYGRRHGRRSDRVAVRVRRAHRRSVAHLRRRKVPHRLRHGARAGRTCTAETSKFGQLVMDETHGRGVDVVIDAAAALETINLSIAVARTGGQMVLIGIPSENELNIDIVGALSKELNLQTIRRSNHNSHAALAHDGGWPHQ